MTKQEIYDQIIGSVCNVENEFADGKPCSELYGRVYDARLRLSERTGIDFEDPDLMEIVESLEEITRICSLKMFDYGKLYMNEKQVDTSVEGLGPSEFGETA